MGTAAGDDTFARFVIVVYTVSVIIMLANIFIATLNDLFSAAVRKISIEMEDRVYDPIDYMLLHARGGYWKVVTTVFNIVKNSKVGQAPTAVVAGSHSMRRKSSGRDEHF